MRGVTRINRNECRTHDKTNIPLYQLLGSLSKDASTLNQEDLIGGICFEDNFMEEDRKFPAYTYYLYHVPTGKKYYGYRGANKCSPEDDLWKKYFSSSKYVKALVKEYGKESFVAEVRKMFDTAIEARSYETRFLRRVNAIEKEEWLNKAYMGKHFYYVGFGNTNAKGHVVPDELKETLSNMHKGNLHHKDKLHSQDAKNKMRDAHLGIVHDEEWNKRIGKAQMVSVQTPLGIFESLKDAATAHGCVHNTIKNRCKTLPLEYKILNEKEIHDIS